MSGRNVTKTSLLLMVAMDLNFAYELVEKGLYNEVEDILSDALKGSKRKEHLKNISKKEPEKRFEIVAHSFHEYLGYLYQIDEEMAEKIRRTIAGEMNLYEKEVKRLQETNEDIYLKQRMEEWKKREEYDPNFKIQI